MQSITTKVCTKPFYTISTLCGVNRHKLGKQKQTIHDGTIFTKQGSIIDVSQGYRYPSPFTQRLLTKKYIQVVDLFALHAMQCVLQNH